MQITQVNQNAGDVYNVGFPAWISIEDRLPEIGVRVLICSRFRSIHFAEWGKRECMKQVGWYCTPGPMIIYDKDYVTHWLPLPEPPK